MKRSLCSLAVLPFFYFAVVFGPTNPHAKHDGPKFNATVVQIGPFKDLESCGTMANLLTVNSSAGVPGANPYYLPNSVPTACWSDS